MKYVNAKGLDLSVFSLGTVQLGLTYGLGKDKEKPSEEAAFSILDTAMENHDPHLFGGYGLSPGGIQPDLAGFGEKGSCVH